VQEFGYADCMRSDLPTAALQELLADVKVRAPEGGVPRGRASELISAVLEEAIVTGLLTPGTHLTENQVSMALDVSRTPVREAFRVLEGSGWLAAQPYAGASVRYPSAAQIADTFELRQGLEEWSIELSALRIEPKQVDHIGSIVREGLAACDVLDYEEMNRLNWEFHINLVRASGNRALEDCLGQLQRQIQWHFRVGAGEVGVESWREHEAILVAVAARDIRTARELIRHHIVRTKGYFMSHFNAAGRE